MKATQEPRKSRRRQESAIWARIAAEGAPETCRRCGEELTYDAPLCKTCGAVRR